MGVDSAEDAPVSSEGPIPLDGSLPSDDDASGPTGRTGSREIAPPTDVLAEASAKIAGSKRPLVIVGAGAAGGILAAELARRGVSFTEFGQKVDANPQYISQIIRGHARPSAALMRSR